MILTTRAVSGCGLPDFSNFRGPPSVISNELPQDTRRSSCGPLLAYFDSGVQEMTGFHQDLSDSQFQDDLNHIEQFVLDLEKQPGATNALMREHLDAARFYRTGAMPQEYNFNLKLAQQ